MWRRLSSFHHSLRLIMADPRSASSSSHRVSKKGVLGSFRHARPKLTQSVGSGCRSNGAEINPGRMTGITRTLDIESGWKSVFLFLFPSRPVVARPFSSTLQFERQHLSRRVTAESQTAIMCGASIKVNSLFTKSGRQQSMAPRRSESPSQQRAPPDIPPSSQPPG